MQVNVKNTSSSDTKNKCYWKYKFSDLKCKMIVNTSGSCNSFGAQTDRMNWPVTLKYSVALELLRFTDSEN